jgi:hypothetical protein
MAFAILYLKSFFESKQACSFALPKRTNNMNQLKKE